MSEGQSEFARYIDRTIQKMTDDMTMTDDIPKTVQSWVLSIIAHGTTEEAHARHEDAVRRAKEGPSGRRFSSEDLAISLGIKPCSCGRWLGEDAWGMSEDDWQQEFAKRNPGDTNE